MISSRKELYIEFLKDMYSAEVHSVEALHFFEHAASDPILRQLIHNHAGETRMQVLRMEELIENYDETLDTDHCHSMQTMIGETKELVNRCSEGEVKDLAIIATMKRVNQCEMEVYSILNDMAATLAPREEVELLEYNYKEEEEFQAELYKLDKPVAD